MNLDGIMTASINELHEHGEKDDALNDARPWNERYALPLSEEGISFAGMKRLLRARRNGGSIRSILRRYGK